MACCAFAFFIVAQLLWPVRWFRAQFGVSTSDAAAWSLGAAEAPSRTRIFASTTALMLAASTLLIAVTIERAPHEQICSTHDARGN